MRTPRAALLLIATSLGAVVGAACDSSADGPDATSGPEHRRPAARATNVADTGALDALFAAYESVADAEPDDDDRTRHAEKARLARELRAAGKPALDRLAAMLLSTSIDEVATAHAVLPAFGRDAVPAALACIRRPVAGDAARCDALSVALEVLDATRREWREDALASDVSAALMAASASEPDAEARVEIIVALGQVGPAAAPHAEEMGRRLAAAPPESRDADAWLQVLEALGPDACAAAPFVVARIAGADCAMEVRILQAMGGAAPPVVETMREILRTGSDEARIQICEVLRVWGNAGAAAQPDLIALVDSESSDLMLAARQAISMMTPSSDAIWRAVLSRAAAQPWGQAHGVLSDWARDAAFAARIESSLVQLPRAERTAAVAAILGGAEGDEAHARDSGSLVASLLDGADAGATRRVLDLAYQMYEDPFTPDELRVLLRDEAAIARAQAAYLLASRDDPPGADVIAATLPLLTHADSDVRYAAFEALRVLGSDDPRVRDALVAALADPVRRDRAIAALAATSSALSISPAVQSALADEIVREAWRADALIAVLLRADGGAATLRARLLARLGDVDSEGLPDGVARAARIAGPELAGLLPVLRARAAAAESDWERGRVATAIAWIERDAEAVAANLQGALDGRETASLATLGAPGFAAIVRLVGRSSSLPDGGVLESVLEDELLTDAVKRAAALPGDDDDAVANRRGAALLSFVLTPDDRAELRARLLHDPQAVVREAVANSVAADARSGRADVALADVLPMLDDPDAACRVAALLATGEFGPRAAELAPRLRRAASGDASLAVRVAAVTALWRVKPDASATWAALRELLVAEHGDEDDPVAPWSVLGDVVAQLPADASTVPLLLQTFEHEEIGRGLVALRGLARHGTAAAPALPRAIDLLRNAERPLQMHGFGFPPIDWDGAQVIASCLGAMGAAARPALPALRDCAADHADVFEGERPFAAAIRRIETATR